MIVRSTVDHRPVMAIALRLSMFPDRPSISDVPVLSCWNYLAREERKTYSTNQTPRPDGEIRLVGGRSNPKPAARDRRNLAVMLRQLEVGSVENNYAVDAGRTQPLVC